MRSRKKWVTVWLVTGCVMVMSMVVIGGITRLTHSGLSMTDWNLVTGIVPPLSHEAWEAEFSKYQQSPEFQKLNYDFGIEEFKSIFWWEYIHRLIGRLIGVVFLVPFLIFWWRGFFDKPLIKKLIVVFCLGALQGFLGWFMVKSGLVDIPAVSHYRLAIHLVTALLIVGYIFWVLLGILYPKPPPTENHSTLKKWTIGFLVLTVLQVIYGAFVAGLKAGLIHNTFPKMDGYWISPVISLMYEELGMMSLFEAHSTVQFIHRILAYLIVIYAMILWYRSFSKRLSQQAIKGYRFIGIWVWVQALLGILTLIYRVPVMLGVMHQLGAAILLLAIIYCLYFITPAKFSGQVIPPSGSQ